HSFPTRRSSDLGTKRSQSSPVVDTFVSMRLYTGVAEDALLHALAEPRRRAILRLVKDQERPAGEIAAAFPDVTGPAISQHLRVLRQAGLVQERRDGTRRLYRARPEGLAELRALLRDFWDEGLAQLKDAAEDQQRRKGSGRGRQ